MAYYIMLLILAFVLCGGLADSAGHCKQCADIIHTTPMNSTEQLPTCVSAPQPTPCNGTAIGCAKFNGNVSFGLKGTTNVTIKFLYCSASNQTVCYDVTNRTVRGEPSGLFKAFSEDALDPTKRGFGLGQLQDIDGRICTSGFQSPVVNGQNKLFPSIVILVLALICQ